MSFSNEHMDSQTFAVNKNSTSLEDHNFASISSADYALNVIFSQFENAADTKMSLILNLGVVRLEFWNLLDRHVNPPFLG